MYPLDQVLKPDFSRSWQEAVALVQEVALALGDLKTLAAPEDLFLEEDATVATRRLNDGREFQIVKIYYDPAELQNRLAAHGFQVEVRTTDRFFLYATGTRVG